MRALGLTGIGGLEHLAILDLPPPALTRPDQVRIAVKAIALNHLDLWVANGLPNVPIPSFPHVVGADAAGVVLQVGNAVANVKPGDRVVVNPGVSCGECHACEAGEEVFCRQFALFGEHRAGVAAEEIVIPARNLAVINDKWSWPEAAAFSLTTLTAWRMLVTRAAVNPGEHVLIWGIGGGVALQALQIANYLGAQTIVTSSSDPKLAKATELGATFTINHATHDVPAEVKRLIGRGADVVVDNVGAPTWPRSLKALRPGGRLVSCGATGGAKVEIDLRRMFWFQWSLLGSTMGTGAEFAAVVALGNDGRFRPVVDSVRPLSEAAAAYQRLLSGVQFGKLVLEVAP